MAGGLKADEQAALQQELGQIVAAQGKADPEEAQRRQEMSLADRRVEWGLAAPELPRPYQEAYEQDWSDWEAPFLDVAHDTGLTSAQVNGLRDAAITLGQEIGERGAPATESELTNLFDRHGISANLRAPLVELWRRIENGGGA